MTLRKVAPTATKVNEKNSDKSHGSTDMFPHRFERFFCPQWTIFPVKNLFSWIFPAPWWSPYQSLFLRYELEKGLRAV